MKAKHKRKNCIVRYFERTYKNKLFAIALFAMGYSSMFLDGDCTFFVFMLIFALPLFFTSEKWVAQGSSHGLLFFATITFPFMEAYKRGLNYEKDT